jgi:homoserine kinase type II
MAVFTPLSKKEVSAHLENYELGALVGLQPIAAGIENTNYKLTTENGTYVLTLIEGRTQEQELPFVFEVLDHLDKAGLPIAGGIRDKSDKIILTLKGRTAVIVAFLRGESRLEPAPGDCQLLGQMLARLHLASSNFCPTRPNPLALSDLDAYAAGFSGTPDDIEPGLSRRLTDELEYLRHSPPSKLQTGIVHGDLFPDNVLFDGDKISGLIDFYFVSSEVLIYDLAICINCWCAKENGEIDRVRACAMVRGYQSRRRLSPDEMLALPYYLRAAAVRFMITRINDWFVNFGDQLVEKKDPLEYARILAFHQKHQDRDFYGFG